MKYIHLIIFLFITCAFYSQDKGQRATINGKIHDAKTNQPLPYATITLLNLKDSNFSGTITDNQGGFLLEVPYGNYKVTIQFLSFKPFVINELKIEDDLDLGVFEIEENSEILKEVEVNTTGDLVEYKFDKKIYSAGKDIANMGGNALTVLENTPTVMVDDQGRLMIRGNEATVLMNGKPFASQSNYQNILMNLPANSISQVEIISRSAKYDAQGGGIINLVLKKGTGDGYNGTVEVHGGIPDDDGVSTFINYNGERINVFSTAGFNHQDQIKYSEIEQFQQNSQTEDPVFFETRDDNRQRNSFLFNIGSEFMINEKNSFNSSFLYSMSNKNFDSDLMLTDLNMGQVINQTDRNVDDNTDDSFFELLLNYTTSFKTKEHSLSFDLKYDHSLSDNITDIVDTAVLPAGPQDRQKTTTDQTNSTGLFQVDYAQPINNFGLVETGVKTNIREYESALLVYDYDPIQFKFNPVSGRENNLSYDEKVYAAYLNFSKELNSLNFSLGLRTEYTDVRISDLIYDNTTVDQYTDFFPTANLGYTFKDESLLTLYYSRSISRPGVAQLNPFISFADERFIVMGNPLLKPYYTDYFVTEYFKKFGAKVSLNTALFASMDDDQILTVLENTGNQTDDGFDIYTRKPVNNGDLNQYGIEMDLVYNASNALRFRALLSPYYFEIINTTNGAYDTDDFVLYGNAIADYKFLETWKFQINYTYQSPKTTGLTELKAIQFVNLALSKDLFKSKATLSFTAKDIFRSREIYYESMEAGIQTNSYAFFEPQYLLSFSYRFNGAAKRNSKNRSGEVNKNIFELDEEVIK